MRHRSERSREQGVFARIMMGLAAENAESKTIMIDATYLKAHRTASSLRANKGGVDDRSGAVRRSGNVPVDRFPEHGWHEYQAARCHRCQGPPDPVLHVGGTGKRLHRCGSSGSGSLPEADWLLADRGHDADWLRAALEDKGTKACIPAGHLERRL